MRTIPEYLNLQNEIGLNSLQVSQLLSILKEYAPGADLSTWVEVQRLARETKKLLDSTGIAAIVSENPELIGLVKASSKIEELLSRIDKGAEKHKVWKEVNEANEYRRKLVETELKRTIVAKNNMPAEEVMKLFRTVCEMVKHVFYNHADELELFAKELDGLALGTIFKQQGNALGARTNPSALMNPSSEAGDLIRQGNDGKQILVFPNGTECIIRNDEPEPKPKSALEIKLDAYNSIRGKRLKMVKGGPRDYSGRRMKA